MGKTILVVDDETSFLDIMSAVLPRAGYTVLLATHGEEALKTIYNPDQHIDLILLDDMLPGKSGSEICVGLKHDERVKHIPVLLYSAGPRVRDPHLMEQVGADKVLFKPFKTPELIKVIHSFFAPTASNAPTVEVPALKLSTEEIHIITAPFHEVPSQPPVLPEQTLVETQSLPQTPATTTSELAPTKPALPALDDETYPNVSA